MPARRVLRTLTIGFDVAVFLWRRYGSVFQSSDRATNTPPVLTLDQKGVVSVAEDGEEDFATERTQTVNFGLDGQNYAIDLSDRTAAELRETLGRYVAAGRRVGRQTRTGDIAPAPARAAQPARADGQDAAAIREWARVHGHRISDRGPIPATVRRAYADRRPGRAG